jgi:hypothetical protein
MPIQAGDIIYITANFVQPKPKPKYMICVCPVQFYYMIINTDPYLQALAAQLSVTTTDIPGLDHSSHVDTSRLVRLTAMENGDSSPAKP